MNAPHECASRLVALLAILSFVMCQLTLTLVSSRLLSSPASMALDDVHLLSFDHDWSPYNSMLMAWSRAGKCHWNHMGLAIAGFLALSSCLVGSINLLV